ncbi:MAG TPA: hypothetical protein VHV79_10895 [Mycobacteriales bacterium]|jgi:hypothetical protein|nr:hypothetical protein [Mycobacteriales bacterium]
MHSQPNQPAERTMRSVVTHAETEAERLLDADDTAPLEVVAWLSAHLAALERAVYPVVRHQLPDGQRLVDQHREIAAQLTRVLRVIERHHSGDALASGLSSARLTGNLRSLIAEHHLAETLLLDRLAKSMTGVEQLSLVGAYESALEHAPTRPHPHLSRGGLMFRLDGLRDRILDVMDGRRVPVPRLAKRHITPGRWGSYFLGQPHEHSAESRDAG